MSLEDALEANTAAVQALTVALRASLSATVAAIPPAPPKASPTKAAAPEAPKVEKPAAAPKPAPEPVEAKPVEVKAAAVGTMIYTDIQEPFLKKFVPTLGLEAAKKLLTDFGVPPGSKLSAVPEAQWPAVLATMDQRLAEHARAAEEGSLG